MCHFLYFKAISAEETSPTEGGVASASWGEVRYLNEFEWADGGSNITGVTVQRLGTALTSALNGFALSNVALTNYSPGATYTMTWYQPPYAATYCDTCLRRYNGDINGFSKIRPYCVAGRNLTTVTKFGVTAADVTGVNGVVSLSGATTMLAGAALVFGSAMLAF